MDSDTKVNPYLKAKTHASIEVFASNIFSIRIAKCAQLVHKYNTEALSGIMIGRFPLDRKEVIDKELEIAVKELENNLAKIKKLTRNHSRPNNNQNKPRVAKNNKPGNKAKPKMSVVNTQSSPAKKTA